MKTLKHLRKIFIYLRNDLDEYSFQNLAYLREIVK